MKKTTITIATLSLILTLAATAFGQPRRRAPQQVGNPFGLGGTVTAGVKNRKPMNLGDTGTHEVGHVKGNRRPTPKGWSFGASNPTVVNNQSTGKNLQNNRTRAPQPKSLKLGDIKGEVINSQQPNAAKYDGIDGESNNARTNKLNGQRKTRNLLPYMEQSNLKARPRAKQFGAGNQAEAKTKGN